MKKIIYLVRHSENIRDNSISNHELPLSKNGIEKAKKLKEVIGYFDEVWSSTYKRAMETASLISTDINISASFDERKLGTVTDIKYWEKQLKDLTVKVVDGESGFEVQERMYNKLIELLKNNKEKIVIVSHGAAITFLLLKWCKLEDASYIDKRRHLKFNNKDIINDNLSMPDCFKLEFEDLECINIQRIRIEN